MEELERSLQEQQEVNEALRQAQGDLSAYEAQLEAQVRAREGEVAQLKQELEQRTKQQQVSSGPGGGHSPGGKATATYHVITGRELCMESRAGERSPSPGECADQSSRPTGTRPGPQEATTPSPAAAGKYLGGFTELQTDPVLSPPAHII